MIKILEAKGPQSKDAGQTKKRDDEDGGDIDSFLKSGEQQLLPAVINYIEKLDQQLYKAFQKVPSTTMEYLLRLRDECTLLK